MPDFDLWMIDSTAIDEMVRARAVGAWNRIQRNPVSVVVVRDGTALDAQIVRIESDSTARQIASDAGRAGAMRRVVYGVRDHPTIDDSDLRSGDRFMYDGVLHEIVQIAIVPGEVQGFAEIVT
jgi:hypothetical protein